MKRQNLVNLVKYHTEGNDTAFKNEVNIIANEFSNNGDRDLADYLMELISSADAFIPQSVNSYKNYVFLKKSSFENQPLYLPDSISENITGIIRAINSNYGISKVLFYGKPGSGKTEAAYQVARVLNRDLLSVAMEQVIDSKLGQSSKNIVDLFDEIKRLPSNKVIVLFDELDSLVMDRVNAHDIREMGRVTSTFLRELDSLPSNVIIIATTNLVDSFDKALFRRFDAKISFDDYSREDLIEIAGYLLSSYLKNSNHFKMDMRMFNKILNNLEKIPFPADLKQTIKISVALANYDYEYDYLRKIYLNLNKLNKIPDIEVLKKQGFTMREIEILTSISKSSVSRKLKG